MDTHRPAGVDLLKVASILTDLLGRPIRYGKPGAIRYLLHATKQLDLPAGHGAGHDRDLRWQVGQSRRPD